MSAKRAISLIMAKMAMVDGEIVVAEREFLRPLLDHGECLETFVQEASRVSLNEIVSNLTNYADKFYVALRASSMSHIDQSEHPTERALYMELLDLLELSCEDQELIERAVTNAGPPDPRIMEIFLQSSLAF